MRRRMGLKIVAAYGLDACAGDPRGYPHPVRLMGALTDALVRRSRMARGSAADEARAGALVGICVVTASWVTARLALRLPGSHLVETLMISTCIARKDLAGSARAVADALQDGDLDRARGTLAALAGRDAVCLDAQGVARAAIESVAENFVDGVLSPLLWAAVGGAPAAMAFKAVSTLDSMIGYRDPDHLHIGRFSARADDAANLLPARVAIPVIAASSCLTGLDASGSLRVGLRDRLRHESPNSAHAEAAFAGALGLRLGGPADYGGEMREHPFVGEGRPDAGPREIKKAVGLMNAASLLAVCLAALVARRWRG